MKPLLSASSVLLMLFCFDAYAQASGAASAPSVEVQVLKAQLESMRSFQDSFMSMAQWALGTAIAVVLSLAAFSWFTSKSNYERDRDLLKQQAQALKDEIAVQLQKELLASRQSLESGLAARQGTIQKAVEAAVNPKIQAAQSAAKDALDLSLEMKASAVFEEAKAAQNHKRYEQAVYKYCQALEIYIKRQTDLYEASDALDAINEILKTPGISMDADTVTSAVEILQRLPKQHHPVSESLIARLKKALA
jgi:hypothetical protein